MKQPCAFKAEDGWWYPGYLIEFKSVETEGSSAAAFITNIAFDPPDSIKMGNFVICDDIEQAGRLCMQFDEEIEKGMN